MPASKHSDEEILQILKSLATRLGKPSLSKKDVATVLSVSVVANRFGSLGNALEAANLIRTNSKENFKGRAPTLSEDQLFAALYEVENKVGREPTGAECSAHCKYSQGPFLDRFGKWSDVRAHYRKWKAVNDGNPSNASSETPLQAIKERVTGDAVSMVEVRTIMASSDAGKRKPPQQFYGEPIDFRGLRHAPINEQGVVFLFGLVSRELGFNIESVQQGFPDCEGKYLHDRKKNLWAKARIEFEYKSSNFEEHGHNADQCDFIVCWVNDWPECPVNVIELKSEILKLSPR